MISIIIMVHGKTSTESVYYPVFDFTTPMGFTCLYTGLVGAVDSALSSDGVG